MSETSTIMDPDALLNCLTERTVIETRLCSRCRRWLPIGAFRLRHKGSEERHTTCRLCNNEYLRERRQQRRRATFRKYTAAVNRGRCPDDLRILAAEMARRFGGIQGVAHEWKAAIEAEKAAGRHDAVMRSLVAVAQLQLAGEQLAVEAQAVRASQDAKRHMGREEIVESMTAIVRRLCQQEPGFVIAVAASVGWEMRPPDSEEWVKL